MFASCNQGSFCLSQLVSLREFDVASGQSCPLGIPPHADCHFALRKLDSLAYRCYVIWWMDVCVSHVYVAGSAVTMQSIHMHGSQDVKDVTMNSRRSGSLSRQESGGSVQSPFQPGAVHSFAVTCFVVMMLIHHINSLVLVSTVCLIVDIVDSSWCNHVSPCSLIHGVQKLDSYSPCHFVAHVISLVGCRIPATFLLLVNLCIKHAALEKH